MVLVAAIISLPKLFQNFIANDTKSLNIDFISANPDWIFPIISFSIVDAGGELK